MKDCQLVSLEYSFQKAHSSTANETVSYKINTKLSDFNLNIDIGGMDKEYIFEYTEYDKSHQKIFFERYEWNEDKSLKSLCVGFTEILFCINLENSRLKNLHVEKEYFTRLIELEKKVHFPLFKNFEFLNNISICIYSLVLKGGGITDEVTEPLVEAISRIDVHTNSSLHIEDTSLRKTSYTQFIQCEWVRNVTIIIDNPIKELEESLKDNYRRYQNYKEIFGLIIDGSYYLGKSEICPTYNRKSKEFTFCLGEDSIQDFYYFLEHFSDEVVRIKLTYHLNGSAKVMQGYNFEDIVKQLSIIFFPNITSLWVGEHFSDYGGAPIPSDIGDLSLILEKMPKLEHLIFINCSFRLSKKVINDIFLSYENEYFSPEEFSKETIFLGKKLFRDNDEFVKAYPELITQFEIKDTTLIIDINDLEEICLVDGGRWSSIYEVESFNYLEVLNICHTELKTLPKEIGNLTKLVVLWLSSNNLENLPDEICELKNLNALMLDNNPKLELSEKQVKWIKALKSRECHIDLDERLVEKYGLDE